MNVRGKRLYYSREWTTFRLFGLSLFPSQTSKAVTPFNRPTPNGNCGTCATPHSLLWGSNWLQLAVAGDCSNRDVVTHLCGTNKCDFQYVTGPPTCVKISILVMSFSSEVVDRLFFYSVVLVCNFFDHFFI
jgi:hypothetical protein